MLCSRISCCFPLCEWSFRESKRDGREREREKDFRILLTHMRKRVVGGRGKGKCCLNATTKSLVF